MKIYCSAENCGDGSVSISLFDNYGLAEWHQEHMDEGWGEPCITTISLKSDSPIHCEDIEGPIEFYIACISQLYGDEQWEDKAEFQALFFPDGLPTFQAVAVEDKRCVCNVSAFVDGKCAYTTTVFINPTEVNKFQANLN